MWTIRHHLAGVIWTSLRKGAARISLTLSMPLREVSIRLTIGIVITMFEGTGRYILNVVGAIIFERRLTPHSAAVFGTMMRWVPGFLPTF